MTKYDANISALIQQAMANPEKREAIKRALLEDFSESLGRKILAIFSGRQKDIIRKNPITGRDAVPFFDVLEALGSPVPSGRCKNHWFHLRDFVERSHQMFLVYGLNRNGNSTPYIDLDAIEMLTGC
ncbi:hypothetical protein [Acuticoccus kandeliae]|uniref:hypothetical protein n=1 Tax=Acuticoccus kandeliae TaxID=2073160 RepID=UPI000D3E36DD|nr:hypothetical protein [Acuticoccus kandeliae]